jgi:competence protein ComEC
VYESTQSFLLETEENQKLSIQTSLTYNPRYADRVELLGVIQPLSTSTQYLAREGVLGTVSFARIDSITAPKGFSLYRFLYSIRDSITDVFTKIFSRDQAALASGLLLGQQSASFSKELKDDMKASGTTHLVALSGYNIAIVIQVLYGLISFVLSRKKSFLVMVIGIVLFVLMTGAEASVVRAAIMGSLVLVAERLSRVYNFAHAMAATAWVMVLCDPLSFAFDIGFVLSFVSLWGLAYIAPIISALLKRFEKIPLWIAQALSQTIGAQIAVAPLLLYWFGGMSVSGVVTNTILLPLVPFTMGLSFVVGLIGLVLPPLAWIGSFVVVPLLSFFIGAIHIGAQFGFIQYAIPWWGVVVCYILLLWVGIQYKRKYQHNADYRV